MGGTAKSALTGTFCLDFSCENLVQLPFHDFAFLFSRPRRSSLESVSQYRLAAEGVTPAVVFDPAGFSDNVNDEGHAPPSLSWRRLRSRCASGCGRHGAGERRFRKKPAKPGAASAGLGLGGRHARRGRRLWGAGLRRSEGLELAMAVPDTGPVRLAGMPCIGPLPGLVRPRGYAISYLAPKSPSASS
jgi:hypothetical protein